MAAVVLVEREAEYLSYNSFRKLWRANMLTNAASRTLLLVAMLLAGERYSLGDEEVKPASSSENLFRNPNFEVGKTPWALEAAEKTVAQFAVDDGEAPMVAIVPW